MLWWSSPTSEPSLSKPGGWFIDFEASPLVFSPRGVAVLGAAELCFCLVLVPVIKHGVVLTEDNICHAHTSLPAPS